MQKSTPTSRSEGGKRINTQMNREITTPNNGTIPRQIPSPGTRNVPNITNRRPINEAVPPVPGDKTTPPIGMPLDRGTPPNTTTPTNRGTTPSTPINRVTTPPAGVPLNGRPVPMNGNVTPPAGGPINGMPRMPMNGNMTPPAGTPINGMPRMPMNGNMTPPAGAPINGMPIMPNNTPYNTPMGVPLYPLYGYDNCEDLDRDMDYFRQLYPSSARRIQGEINNECDKLEYDGSIMFDEYPDKIALDRIIDRVYENIKDMDEAPQLEANSVYYYPRRRQNILRDFVSIILLNEIFNRRRRYRSRRRWF